VPQAGDRHFIKGPGMRIFDISLPISPAMAVWPGDPPVVLERVSSMDAGAHDNVSRLSCSVHTGTHVDAPYHFLNDHRTAENISLESLVGPAQVIQIPDTVDLITATILDGCSLPGETKRLLIKTRNSRLWERKPNEFVKNFVGISEDGARWLVQAGLVLVGIDYLSIAPFKQSVATHRVLLKTGMIILEGLDLRAVSPGSYQLYCLPLKLVGSDGAPARAILVD
jgi:arylformamidase